MITLTGVLTFSIPPNLTHTLASFTWTCSLISNEPDYSDGSTSKGLRIADSVLMKEATVKLGDDGVELLSYSIPGSSNCVVPVVGNSLIKSHRRRKTVKSVSQLGGTKQLLNLKVAKKKFGRIKRIQEVGKEVVKGDVVAFSG